MAALLMIYLVAQLGLSTVLPFRPAAKPLFYKWMEDAALDLEQRLNRENRPQSVRIVRGAAVALILAALALMIGFLFAQVSSKASFGFIAQLVFLYLCMSFVIPLKLVSEIRRLLQSNQALQAASLLRPYMQETLENPDGHAVVRKTIEFIALSLNRFLVGPAVWFVIGNTEGLALYVAFSAMQQAFGLPDPRRRYFGHLVCNVDMLLNIIPGVVSVALLVLGACFVSRSNPLSALSVVFTHPRRQPVLYQDWLLAGIAGGLGVTLGGPIRYSAEYTENRPWIGPKGATAKLVINDLARAALLEFVFFICLVGLSTLFIITGYYR